MEGEEPSVQKVASVFVSGLLVSLEELGGSAPAGPARRPDNVMGNLGSPHGSSCERKRTDLAFWFNDQDANNNNQNTNDYSQTSRWSDSLQEHQRVEEGRNGRLGKRQGKNREEKRREATHNRYNW